MSLSSRRQRGFNLIEVMAAVLVVALGLLGLAKVQAMAVGDAATSGVRSLVSLEVQSLQAAMHANPGYWQSASAVGACPIVSSGPTSTPSLCSTLSAAAPTATSGCLSSVCTASQMAAYDVQQWANTLNTLLPGFGANITCASGADNSATTGGSVVYSCTTTVNWSEHTIALNKATVLGNNAPTSMAFTSTVWP